MSYRLSTDFDLTDPDVISVIDDLALWSAPFGLKLLEVVRLRRGLRVLDVGSGCGFPAVELSQRLDATGQLFALDPWHAALRRAHLKANVWSIPNLHLVAGRAETIPFADASFDLVVSNNGTNNVQDEDRAYAELARVARPGAELVLTMNLPETMMEFYSTLEQVLRDQGLDREVTALQAHIHDKRKPLGHLERLLAATGFDLETTHEEVFTLRYTDGTTMLNHFLIRLAFLESWTNLVPRTETRAVFDQAEALLNERARREGQLTLTVPWVCLEARRSS